MHKQDQGKGKQEINYPEKLLRHPTPPPIPSLPQPPFLQGLEGNLTLVWPAGRERGERKEWGERGGGGGLRAKDSLLSLSECPVIPVINGHVGGYLAFAERSRICKKGGEKYIYAHIGTHTHTLAQPILTKQSRNVTHIPTLHSVYFLLLSFLSFSFFFSPLVMGSL